MDAVTPEVAQTAIERGWAELAWQLSDVVWPLLLYRKHYLDRLEIDRRGLTLIGFTIANLDDDPPCQLCLPLEPGDSRLLDGALDEIRNRYGSSAVTRGVLVGRRPDLAMPLLPD